MKTVMMSATLFAVVLMATHAQANLLDDGSFEAATPGGITTNSAWSFAANKPSSDDFSAQFQMAPFSASEGETGVWFKSFTGNEEVSGTAVLIQTISAPSDGTYSLTFDAAREANFLADEWYVALSSGSELDSVDLLTAAIPPGSFADNVSPFSLSVPAVTAGSTVNVFAVMTGGVDAGANPQSAFLDNFVLVVPEPSSILLAAMGLLGCMRIRRF